MARMGSIVVSMSWPAAREPHQSSSATTIAPWDSMAAQKSGLSSGDPLIRIRGPSSGGRVWISRSASCASGAYSVRSMKYQAPISASASEPRSLGAGPSRCCNNPRMAWRAAFPSAMAAERASGSIRCPVKPLQSDLQIASSLQSVGFSFRRPARAAGCRESARARVPVALAHHLAQIKIELVFLFGGSGNDHGAQRTRCRSEIRKSKIAFMRALKTSSM